MRLTTIIISIFLLSTSVEAIDIEWTHILDENTGPFQFIQTEDGGFLIYGDYNNSTFTRLNSELEVVWRRSWHIFEGKDAREKFLVLPDGRYAIIGNRRINCDNEEDSESDVFLFEFNNDGDSLCYYVWESDEYIVMGDAVLLDDGGYIILAYVALNDRREEEYIAFRVDSEHEIIWREMLQRPMPQNHLWCITPTDDGCFLIGGHLLVTRPDYKTYGHIVKIDPDGEIIWRLNYLGPEERSASVSEILNLSDGRYAATGSVSDRDNYHTWYLEFNSDGEELVNRRITDLVKYWGSRHFIVSTNGEFFLVLRIEDLNLPEDYNSGYILVRTNKDGDSLDCHLFHNDSLYKWHNVDIIPTSDGGAIILGMLFIEQHNPRIYLQRDVMIKIAPTREDNVVESDLKDVLPLTSFLSPVCPNPFNSIARITYELNDRMDVCVAVFNTKGQQVAVLDRGERAAGVYNLIWEAEGIPSGVYFIELSTPVVKQTRKVMLTK
ncbi:T9SS type A sorting domain-containing protein [bacterium]|nr:T9SS type A sorting domain-containing protein [bacterium]